MSKNLVIVESPAKAHTIEKYLGSDFKVLASVGHIRKDTKVDKETFDVTYEIDEGHKKIISELKKEAKAAEKIWLATDEDREGESISWHLTEVLKLPKDTARITFHEITKPALENAIKNPRVVDMDMVASQQARQTLDMLVGFDLSDIVRRKVPGAISAGRVQSPALRLVVEREKEIEKFESKSSFKVTGKFTSKKTNPGQKTNSSLAAETNQKVNSMPTAEINPSPTPEEETSFDAALEGNAPTTEEAALALLNALKASDFVVSEVEETEGTKANPVPFTTAALQIEANSKLGFSSKATMSAAQGLYQAGLITYHRTDSLNLSSQAVAAISQFIKTHFGKNYLKVRHFKTKDASAQEAHEAIRPTDISRTVAGKNDYEKRLYNLIWSRTVATQMANAKVAKTTIRLKATNTASAGVLSDEAPLGPLRGARPSLRPFEELPPTTPADMSFVAKGEVVIFDGFLKVYGKSKDLELPHLEKGDPLNCLGLTAKQSFAKPPARYTEGSLVKKLEELGIGRPSTYASIMTAIQARGYAIKGESEGETREVVEFTVGTAAGRTTSLVDTEIDGDNDMTADGDSNRTRINQSSSIPIDAETKTKRSLVEEKFGANRGKLVPTPIGELVAGFLTDNFKNIVDYKFTAHIEKDLDLVAEAKLARVKMLRDFYGPFRDTVLVAQGVERYNNARLLGHDPETGKPVYAKIGKTGGFIQLGDNSEKSTKKGNTEDKPRFAPLPKRKSVKTVTLEQALKQLALPSLPRILGKTTDGVEIIAASGPFGPYLKGGKYNITIKDRDPYTITFEEALPLYEAKVNSIIADWNEIMIINGAYGPYIKGPGRRNNLRVPKDMDPKSITLEQAKEMLENKPKTARRGSRGRGTTKKKKH